MCTLLCVCPPRVESLFPQVLSKSCNEITLGFKVWFSRSSSSRCWTPRLGSLMWGSEPSFQWVDFCGISVLQSVSHPPSSYGIWFYCNCSPPTVSLWLLLCLWMWGIFFGNFQCLPVDDCPTASCDSGVLTRGSESTSFYSAIVVPLLFTLFFHYLLPFFRQCRYSIFPKLFIWAKNYSRCLLQSCRELKFFPLREFCKDPNKWTSEGAMSGGYGGWIRTFQPRCNSLCVVIKETCGLVLSWWKIMRFFVG